MFVGGKHTSLRINNTRIKFYSIGHPIELNLKHLLNSMDDCLIKLNSEWNLSIFCNKLERSSKTAMSVLKMFVTSHYLGQDNPFMCFVLILAYCYGIHKPFTIILRSILREGFLT
jgi:hypothetical protein